MASKIREREKRVLARSKGWERKGERVSKWRAG